MRKKAKNAFVTIEKEPFVDLGAISLTPTQLKKSDPIVEVPKWENNMNVAIVGIHKLYDNVETPKYQTEKSACFDIPAYFGDDIVVVDSYNRLLLHVVKSVFQVPERDERGVSIEPGESAFIPTGLIIDIPSEFKLLLYPRSGTAGKKHLKLSNSVGVIDEDYTKQLMILVFNDSQQRQTICHGDRIAQAEIVPVYRALFEPREKPIQQKTDRNGGMGSTDVVVIE